MKTYKRNIEPSTAPIPREKLNFNAIKVGLQKLEDAILINNPYKEINADYVNKSFIIKQLNNQNAEVLRKISNLFFNTNGIYQRVCKYMAKLYRFDWYISPYRNDGNINEKKATKAFFDTLEFFDNSYLPKLCQDVSLKIIKNGCYYGYLIIGKNSFSIQELPPNYCRSRYDVGHLPAIEFNMRYFDDNFTDPEYRQRILKLFPKEFEKGYQLYRKHKLRPDYMGDGDYWYLLDPELGFKMNCSGNDVPPMANAIPTLLDLNEAQELDRKKMMQKLLKILIQRVPLDSNDELIFDLDEVRDLHNNAVAMLSKAIGIDVLTTPMEVSLENLADSNTTTTTDELEKVERGVFNALGISKDIFNSSSNLALEKSIIDDEASIRDIILQFNILLNRVISKISDKKYHFRFKFLETTIYNHKELSKMYKEQTQIGYSKMLPQIALGHSQSEILATASFENEILHLSEVMIPPMMSSTMSSKNLGKNGETTNNPNQIDIEEKKTGRPEKADDEKSDKTIANRESM